MSTEPTIDSVKNKILRMLNARPHFSTEIRQKLTRADIDPDLIEEALEWCVEANLLDDLALAKRYANVRRERGFGARRIRSDLLARSLPPDVINEAVEAAFAPGDDDSGSGSVIEDKCVAHITKKYGVAPDVVDSKLRDKAFRNLLSRGHDPDVVQRAISRWISGDGG